MLASRHSRLQVMALAVLGGFLLGETCQAPIPLATPAARTAPDADGDLVADWCDNCRLAANRSQADTDVSDACLIPPGEESGACRAKPGQACRSHADCLVLRGNFCDCDTDGNGVCNIDDFNDFLADRGGLESPGKGTDFNGDGRVDDLDFAPFQAGFAAGAPGDGALPASPVDGSCNPESDPSCTDSYRKGTCFEMRVARFADGSQRPWRIHEASDGCNLDPLLLLDAGFPAAVANRNNPTDALLADQSAGAVRCPNAAFASFSSSYLCDATVPCDPRDHGKPCGGDNGRGGSVTCGDVNVGARACELHDVCESQCGYRSFDCAEQYRQNLFETCFGLTGAERAQCLPTCLVFAEFYAAQAGETEDPGDWTASDLEQELAQCKCCPDVGSGETQPAVCGDGVCSAQTESCHPSSCPEDCGSCTLGARCLTDDDCGEGACSFRGICELLPAGSVCEQAAECRTGVCTSGLCGSSCGDGFCEGTESCGTSGASACEGDCGACPVGAACGVAEDCLSATCTSGVCAGLASLAACGASGACQSGICDLGSCAAVPKQVGVDCGSDAACAGRLCDLGKCVDDPKPAGEACGRHEACATVVEVDPDLPPIGICNLGECLGEGAGVPAGGACDNDLACTDREILFVITPGICNLGTCITWKTVALGDACDNDKACEDGGLCVDGACKATSNSSQPCSSGDECVSGLCDPGNNLCVGVCGDGICEGFPLELCGEDDLLRCRSDCGECLPILSGTFGFGCKGNAECASGICNFGLCLAGPNGPNTLCSGDASCWSGICNFGVCTTGTTGINTPCTTNAKCTSGACNFGLCVEFQSLPIDHICSTAAACESGVCNLGFCSDPVENGAVCNSNVNCQSGVCNFGICIDAGAVVTGLPCTTNAACSSGDCGGIPLLQEAGDFFGFPTPGTCKEVCGDENCEGLETCGFSNLVTTCLPDCGLCDEGAPCLTNFDCESGACNFPVCVEANSVATGLPCTTSAACVSGRCTAGLCVPVCGDETCDDPAELCGAVDSGLECNSDCGKCGNGTLCASNDVCESGVCNFPICIAAGSVATGGLCTTNGACASGSCIAGFCVPVCGDGTCDNPVELCGAVNSGLTCNADCGKCGNGTACLSNAVCTSNVCNFGFCRAAGSVGPGGGCTTSGACASNVCTAGFCAGTCGDGFCTVVPNGETCYANSCQSDCGKCPNGVPCTLNADCASGSCFFLFCVP